MFFRPAARFEPQAPRENTAAPGCGTGIRHRKACRRQCLLRPVCNFATLAESKNGRELLACCQFAAKLLTTHTPVGRWNFAGVATAMWRAHWEHWGQGVGALSVPTNSPFNPRKWLDLFIHNWRLEQDRTDCRCNIYKEYEILLLRVARS